MMFYILVLLLIFFGIFKLWKKRDFEILDVSMLIANFIYVLFFLNQYLIAEDPGDIKNALIFAYLFLYVFAIPFLSVAIMLILMFLQKMKEKYFYKR
jgi:hypothetical protein